MTTLHAIELTRSSGIDLTRLFQHVYSKARSLCKLNATRVATSCSAIYPIVFHEVYGVTGCAHEDTNIPQFPARQSVGVCGSCTCILSTAAAFAVWFICVLVLLSSPGIVQPRPLALPTLGFSAGTTQSFLFWTFPESSARTLML